MTCIAFDGKTLAADKRALSGYTVSATTKIWRHGDQLLATTGTHSVGMEMLAWFKAGRDAAKFPASNRNHDTGCSLVLIEPDGSVWLFERGPEPSSSEGPFHAFGCGEEAALVAMACGLDARAAVEMACRFNSGCGNGIDCLTLKVESHEQRTA